MLKNHQDSLLNKIIQGDALTVLKSFPDDFIDVGVTSPPYNKGENKKGWLVKNVKYSSSNDRFPEEEYQEEQIKVLSEIYRVTKPGGSFFYNHKLRWEKGKLLHPYDWIGKTDWLIRQELIWDRMIASNIRGWRFWQVEERIFWLYKPKCNNYIGRELKSKHSLLTSIWRFPPERNNSHPAPFPLELPVRAIYSVLDEEKGVVLDPYCGSGTTAVAAKLLGCSFIGIDISDSYINSANLRIKESGKELEVFNAEIAKHKVNKTFQDRKLRGEFTGRFRTKIEELDFVQPNFLAKIL